MDPATLLFVLQPTPTEVDAQALRWRGALLPVVLPFAALPPATRAGVALQHDGLPLDLRIAAALDAGLADQAWRLLQRTPGPVTRSVTLELALAGWAARELARLRLPATRDQVLVLGPEARAASGIDSAIALGVVREMSAALAWPRWVGPVMVLVDDLGERDPYPGVEHLARPALPMVRVRSADGNRSEQLGAVLAMLVLDLEPAPAGGWPAWLRVGLAEVAKAKVRGEGPSPLRMLTVRQQAGANALAELLLSRTPDRQLATAMVAPLVHTRRRHLLGKLLDLLRGGAQSAGAVQVAYGLSLVDLTRER